MREQAERLSEETVAAAKATVANDPVLKEFVNRTGAGDIPDVIRRFAENPHANPVDNLGPHFGAQFAREQWKPLGPKPATPPPGQTLGSFLLGRHLNK